MTDPLILTSARLALKPLSRGDAGLLWPYVSNAEIPKYMAWEPHQDPAETAQFLERVQQDMAQGKAFHWGIFSQADNRFYGLVSLIAVTRSHRALTYDRAELAYWLGPEFQGQGIMTEACQRVIRFAFDTLGLHRLVVSHFAENQASQALILRLGFRYIGEEQEAFQKNGRWYNHKLYELLATQLPAELVSPYICPQTHAPLYAIRQAQGEWSQLTTNQGQVYAVADGIPDLTFPQQLPQPDAQARTFYDARVEAYDDNLHLTFYTHNEDEHTVRNRFIDYLELAPGARVLEIACGTGRDSELIAHRLGDDGELILTDISPQMLRRCRERLQPLALKKSFCIANAVHLPFPRRYFDAVYSFGGLGEFSDIKGSLAEMARVTKTGGKVVVGDESMPLWLRNTDFAKILTTTNPQFAAPLPLAELPVAAREVRVQWVIGGVFYLIDFRVGEGEPDANFDYEIPGVRGGTYRTRYEGQLEGVSPQTKALAWQAVRQAGTSMHKWLDEVVKKAAQDELELE